jgi:site-specific DNA-cytosine methylase
MTARSLRSLFAAARGRWTGAEALGPEALAAAEHDAAAAETLALEALRLLAAAAAAAAGAAALERIHTGESPVWGPLADALAQALADEEAP